MKTYEIKQEVRGTEQFLVVKQEQEENLNEYLVKMLEYNSIAGILPLKSQNMNGHTVLNYQLSNKYKFIDLIDQNRIGSKEARLVYDRITDAIVGMGEYFLNADQCAYDLEYLYVDSTLNPYMVYLPYENVRNQEINRVWRDFFLSLLSYLSDGKQDPFYDALMRYLIQPGFKLKDFRSFLKVPSNGGSIQLVSVQDQMNGPESAGSYAKSAPAPKSAAPAVEAQAPDSKQAGMPLPKSGTKQSKEKKQSSLFGMGKKKADAGDAAPLPNVSKVQVSTADQAVAGVNRGSAWSGTIMVGTEEEENGANMANMAQPHLLNNGAYIPMGQFPFTVGKGNASYIVANQTVSRLHATILQQGSSYYIRDEKSTNGTFLNGQKLEAGKHAELHDGDHLKMSNEEFTFHLT